jgi:hypothetical protein
MKSFYFLLFTFFISYFLSAEAQDTINVPQDYEAIQDAINAASNNDVILVADGIYLENISFMGKAITLASHFLIDGDTNHINNTIIDGSQPSNPDDASVVKFITGEDTTSVLCGFTITGGTGMVEPSYGARIGGGIVGYYATGKIIHNKIIGNSVTSTSDAWGGGISIYLSSGLGWVVIENNTISGNQSTAGTGTSTGGGVDLFSCNGRFYNNIITDNQCTCSSNDSEGGGIYQLSFNTGDTLILGNNYIANNVVDAADLARGGGVASLSTYCLARTNTFHNNSLEGYTTVGGGMFIRDGVFTEITGNVFMQNTHNNDYRSLGAGCACIYPAGSVHVENNQFFENTGSFIAPHGSGGGLQVRDGFTHEVIVTRNVFGNNAARFGGGFYSRNNYNLVVSNNLFSENLANDGGGVGMYIPASGEEMRPVFINNTFTNDTANYRGGAAHFNCESNLPILFNCIFYDNSAPTGSDLSFVGSTDSLLIAYSNIDPVNISGPWTGEGNIRENPLFVDPENGNYCIDSCGSPCAAAGTDSIYFSNSWYYAPEHDINSSPRPLPDGSQPDMGAYEVYCPTGIFESISLNSGLKISVYPNPTHGIADFRLLNSDFGRVEMKIYDLHGREKAVVLDNVIPAGEHIVQFDLSVLIPGIYIVKVQTANGVALKKVVVN